MSTNSKNKIKPEFLKNFTKSVLSREISIENGKIFANYQEIINSINTETNQIIQELNLVVQDRTIPYVTLTAQFGDPINKDARVAFINENSGQDFEEKIQKGVAQIGITTSHMLVLVLADGYKNVEDSAFNLDADMIVAAEFFECAMIDILLDIAMFNSFSFFKNKGIKERHAFGMEKSIYAKEEGLPCFYINESTKDQYYSFAFSARRSKEELDINSYIRIWNSFINDCYPSEKHTEGSIRVQLKQHVDYKELPVKTISRKCKALDNGAYLLLRTNRDRTEDIHERVFTLFGISEYEKGKIKIKPISDFEKYKPILENLDVSAFKIIVNNEK